MLFFKQFMKTRLTISLLTAAFLAMPLVVKAGPPARPVPHKPKVAASSVVGNAQDQAVLMARDAFRAGDVAKLNKAAMATGGHVLESYVGYWQLRLRLEERRPDEILTYLDRNAGSLLAEQLRRDWLKVLGKRGEWAQFLAQSPFLVGDDPEVTCYDLVARYQSRDESVLAELKPLWQSPRELPESCMAIAPVLLQSGQWTDAQVWERFRILADANLLVAAKRTLGFLARGEAPDPKQLDMALASPVKYLERPLADMDLKKRGQRELYLLAVARVARNDPSLAASYWDAKARTRFSCTLGMRSRTCCDVTTRMPRACRAAVPLNLSGLACSTTASCAFLCVAASTASTNAKVSVGKNCVSMSTSPSSPSMA